jgi:drug/metabolite transporter (DMT)-like permease
VFILLLTQKLESAAANRRNALLMLAAAAAMWSLGGLLIKLISWNPMAIAGMRSAIAAGTIYLMTGRRPRFTWSPIQMGGAIAYAGTVTFFVVATKLTTAANAVLLQYTAPIYIALLGYWFIRERTTRFDWLIVSLTFGGMLLFFLDNLELGTFWGNSFGVFSGISFGLFILCMRKQKDGSPMETVLLGNLVTAIICLPFMFNSPPDLRGWGALALLGVFQLGIPYIIYSIAIKHVTAMEAVLIPVMEPLLNPVWVFLIIRELPGPWALAGGIVVISAITAHSMINSVAKQAIVQVQGRN